MRHSIAAAGLCFVATSFSIATAAAADDGSSSSSHPLLRRAADLDDADIKKLGTTHVPQGPIVLVLGGLGVALVALIFIVIKVLGSGKVSSSSRQIMAERAKAKTDLRIKGLSHSNNGATPSRRAPTSDTATAVSSPWESPTASRHFFEDYSRRNSHTNALGSHLKGYSPPRGKGAHPESSYNSLSSMVDVPMLMAQGRTNTTFSQDSISSAEGSKSRPYYDAQARVGGPRRPQTQPKPAPNRSSMYRGTDLGVSRKPSTKSHYERSSAVPPAWMDASYEAQGPRSPVSELKRHNTDAGEHSRRNSSANLLDDNDIFATPTLNVPTPLFAAAGASSSSASSSDHSSSLQPVSSHPLSKRTMPASADGHAGGAPANGYGPYDPHQQQQYRQPLPPRWAQTAASPTQQHPSAWQQERPRPRPQQAIPAYPSSHRGGSVWADGLQPRDPSPGGSSGSGAGAQARYFDVEQQAAAYESARPGQFHQQVAPGNGKRRSRGFPAGQAYR